MDASTPPPLARTRATAGNGVAALAAQFAVQGLRHAPQSNVLWCTLCTTHCLRNNNNNNNNDDDNDDKAALCIVGDCVGDVLRHCATRTHLLLLEREVLSGLAQWLPVEVCGQRMLLDHHCVYPRSAWGPGQALLDETIAGGVVLTEDVCGGVKLWPCHKYTIVELLPSSYSAHVRDVTSETSHSRNNGTTHDSHTKECDGDSSRRDACDAPAPSQLSSSSSSCGVFYTEAALPPHLQHTHARRRRWRRVNEDEADDGADAQSSTALLPSFLRERQRVRSERVYAAHDAHALLQLASDAIAGEAALRRRRRRDFAAHNYA